MDTFDRYIAGTDTDKFKRNVPNAIGEATSLTEKVNEIIDYLHIYTELTDEMLTKWNEVYHWIKNEGLEQLIRDRLDEWKEDGTLENIINERIFDDLNHDLEKYKEKMEKLINEFDQLKEDMKRNLPTVSVKDYGAEGDGQTDDSQAFYDALGDGDVHVFVPKGVYRVDQIDMPSNSKISGLGNASVIKLIDGHANENNTINIEEKENVEVSRLKLIWNRKGLDKTVGSGATSSNVGINNSKYVYINWVHAEYPNKHNFDVGVPQNWQEGSNNFHESQGSKFVWLEHCFGIGGGDDNFTTHYSDYIYMSDCIAKDPDANMFDGNGNSNGFEIDEGTRYVYVTNCYSTGASRGFSTEAHPNSPAPQNVTFTNCISDGDLRAFTCRHIGHHTKDQSVSAHNASFVNCTALNPVNTGLYKNLSPLALEISGYTGVNVTNFKAVGGESDIQENVISVHFQSRSITIDGLHVEGFNTAKNDIFVGGRSGTQSDDISITNASFWRSARRSISVGSGVYSINISNISGIASNNTETGIRTSNHYAKISNVNMNGYPNNMKIAGKKYGDNVQLNSEPFMFGSSTGEIGSKQSGVLASTVTPKALGEKSMVMTSTNSGTDAKRSAVMSSYQVQNPDNNSVAGGHSTVGGDGYKSSHNRTWSLRSSIGQITAEGSINGGHDYGDYAEYFESLDGNAIPTGTIVALENDKIRPAQPNDEPIGVISETASVKLGGAPFAWKGRYKRNEFGGYIYQEKTFQIEDEETGEIEEDTEMLPVENPEHDNQKTYTPREERDEWNVVGLIGQCFVRIDETVNAGDKIDSHNGVGTKGSTWQIMKIHVPYDKQKGYGVGIALIK